MGFYGVSQRGRLISMLRRSRSWAWTPAGLGVGAGVASWGGVRRRSGRGRENGPPVGGGAVRAVGRYFRARRWAAIAGTRAATASSVGWNRVPAVRTSLSSSPPALASFSALALAWPAAFAEEHTRIRRRCTAGSVLRGPRR